MRSSPALTVARTAAAAYSGAFVAGSVLSIRRGYPANALELGHHVGTGVYGGIERAALAALWNLVAQMWIASALSGRPTLGGRPARAWLVFLAAMVLAGQVGEPVSHRITTGDLPAPDSAVVLANIVLPMVLLAAARAPLIEEAGP